MSSQNKKSAGGLERKAKPTQSHLRKRLWLHDSPVRRSIAMQGVDNTTDGNAKEKFVNSSGACAYIAKQHVAK